jgi:hypothetical protein
MSNTALLDVKYLINKPRKEIKLISLAKWKEDCCNDTYLRIKNILNLQYLTLDEITDIYSKTYEKKSKPSINRYLKEFEEKELVQNAGRLVKPDQKASEKLYGLRVTIEYVDNLYAEAWTASKERGLELAQKIVAPLQAIYNTGFNPEIIRELVSEYETVKLIKSQELLDVIISKSKNKEDSSNEKSIQILEKINNLRNDETIIFFTNLKFISWFFINSNLEDFMDKFIKSTIPQKITFEQVKSGIFNDLKINQDPEYLYMLNDVKREHIFFTGFDNFMKFMMDIRYASIIKILQANDHPLSISEIHEKYPIAFNIVANKFYCLNKQKEEKLDKEPPSESTIYRLIQDLSKSGLILDALRIKNNSPKDQIIYTTIGKSIIYFEDSDEFWVKEQETWEKVSDLLQEILEVLFEKKIINKVEFHNLLTKVVKERFDSFKNALIIPKSEEIVKYFHFSLNNTELNALMEALGTLNYFYEHKDNILPMKNQFLGFLK